MKDSNGLFQILLAPRVTEKSTLCLEQGNQMVFKVIPSANKSQIKAAVEKMFDVDVLAVQTARVQGKRKRFGRVIGQQKSWKKAVVRLKEGQSIDFFDES